MNITLSLRALWGSPTVYRIGWALVHSVWLTAAVAAVLAATLVVLRRRSANARYLAGCAALLATVVLAIGAFVLVEPRGEQGGARAADAAAHAAPAPAAPSLAGRAAGDAEPPRSAPPVRQSVPAADTHVPAPPPAAADPLPAAPAPAPPQGAVPAPRTEPRAWAARAANALEPLLPWLVAAWAAGVCVLLVWHLGGWLAVGRLRRYAREPADAALVEAAGRLARALRVSRPVRLLESAAVRVPTVAGWLRPVILLPVALAAGLTTDQVEGILAHELAHVRRCDYLVNLLQSLTETVFFYHPAVWWMSRRVRAERENACDDVAVGIGLERSTYAESLARTAALSRAGERGAGVPAGAALGAAGRPSGLRDRISRLLGRDGGCRVRFPGGWAGALATAAGILCLAGLLIHAAAAPNAPGTAPEDPKAPKTRVAQLIQQLGADTEAARAEAYAELMKLAMGEQAKSLAAALESAVYETNDRRTWRCMNLLSQVGRSHPDVLARLFAGVKPQQPLKAGKLLDVIQDVLQPRGSRISHYLKAKRGDLSKEEIVRAKAYWLGRYRRQYPQAATRPAVTRPTPKIDLPTGWVKVEPNPPDRLPGGLYAIGPYQLLRGQAPDAHGLYVLRRENKIGDGYRQLVGRLGVNLHGFGLGADRSAVLEAAAFKRIGSRILASLRYVPAPEGAKLPAFSVYLRARLPKLPPGRYEARIDVRQHVRAGGGRLVPAPEGTAPAIPSLTCTFRVPESAAATQPADTPAGRLQARISKLIAQLGSDTSAEREAAEKALVRTGRPAMDALRAACGDRDAERAARAEAALRQIRERTRLRKEDWRNRWEATSVSFRLSDPSGAIKSMALDVDARGRAAVEIWEARRGKSARYESVLDREDLDKLARRLGMHRPWELRDAPKLSDAAGARGKIALSITVAGRSVEFEQPWPLRARPLTAENAKTLASLTGIRNAVLHAIEVVRRDAAVRAANRAAGGTRDEHDAPAAKPGGERTAIRKLLDLLALPWQTKLTDRELDRAAASVRLQADAAVEAVLKEYNTKCTNAFRHRAVQVFERLGTAKARSALLDIALGRTADELHSSHSWAARAYLKTAEDRADARKLLASDGEGVLNVALLALKGAELDRPLLKRLGEIARREEKNAATWIALRLSAADVVAWDGRPVLLAERVELLVAILADVWRMPEADKKYWPGAMTYCEAAYSRLLGNLVKLPPAAAPLLKEASAGRGGGAARDVLIIARASRGDAAARRGILAILADAKAGLRRAWAARSLAIIGTEADLPLLKRLANTDPLAREMGGDVGPPGRRQAKIYPVRQAANEAADAIGRKGASAGTRPATQPSTRGPSAAPRTNADDAALRRLHAMLAERTPRDWEILPVRTGKVAPAYWPRGEGTEILLRNARRGPKGRVHIGVWIMDRSYDGVTLAPSDTGRQRPVARELARWRGRRTFAGVDMPQSWLDWRALEAILRASARATPARTQPATQPASATTPDAPWSKAVNGLRARLTLRRTEVSNGTPIISTFLELRNVSERAGAMTLAYSSKCLTPRVIDAHGRKLPTAKGPYDGPAGRRRRIVIPRGRRRSVPVACRGHGIPSDKAGLIDLGPTRSWVFATQDQRCFLQAVLEVPKPDKDGDETGWNWHGRIELPPVRVPLHAESLDPAEVAARIERLGRKMMDRPGSGASEEAARALSLLDDRRVIPWYLKAMDTDSYELKFAAIDRLSRFPGDRALEGLKRGMTQRSDNLRLAAAHGLARSPHPNARKLLLSMRNDRYYGVRITVLQTFGTRDTPESRKLLEEMTHDAHKVVRDEARRYLGMLRAAEKAAEAELAKLAETLRKAVGGQWKVRREGAGVGPVLAGLDNSHMVFGFPFDEGGQARFRRFQKRYADPFYVYGATDRYTVASGPGGAREDVLAALGLSRAALAREAAKVRAQHRTGGKAMWQALAARVHPGMTVRQMKVFLPPRPAAPGRGPHEVTILTGALFTITYALDGTWGVQAGGIAQGKTERQWVLTARPRLRPCRDLPHVTTRPATQPAGAGGEWGQAVQGVQVRLRAERRRWAAGEEPVLTADVRNRSKRELSARAWQYVNCDVQLDGTWHSGGVGSGAGPLMGLTAGRQVHGILVRLVDSRTRAPGFRDLRLEPGKHTVRVRFHFKPTGSPDGQPFFAVVSNSVTIDVAGAAPTTLPAPEAAADAAPKRTRAEKPAAPNDLPPPRGLRDAGEKPATTQPLPASLRIEIDARQPADAPVTLEARLTNTSEEDIRACFDSPLLFRAFLTGPGGRTRCVCVTNGAQIEGSFGPAPTLKPGQTVRTPLRLTTYTGADWRRYLPSEHVYLAPGAYQLRLDRLLPGPNPTGRLMARGTVRFTVVRDAALAKARFAELRDAPKDRQRFAEHVLNATLTPQIRRQWYRDIKDPDPKKAVWKLYTLCSFVDPPADVMPAIVAALNVHVNNPNVADRHLHHLLNNAARAMLNRHPPGAGEALLKLATGKFHAFDRGMAIEALRHYYRREMADRIAALLKDEGKWIPFYAARLLAWAGDDRGADVLIAHANAKNASAAAALAYLPKHKAAAETLKKALASKSAEFVKKLKKALANQPPPWSPQADAELSWADAVEGIQCGIALDKAVYAAAEEPRVSIALRNVSEKKIACVLPSADPGSEFRALLSFTFLRRSQGRWTRYAAGVRLKPAKRSSVNPGAKEYAIAPKGKVFRAGFPLRCFVTSRGEAVELEPGEYSVSVTYFIRASTPKYAAPRPEGATLWAGHHLRSGTARFRVIAPLPATRAAGRPQNRTRRQRRAVLLASGRLHLLEAPVAP